MTPRTTKAGLDRITAPSSHRAVALISNPPGANSPAEGEGLGESVVRRDDRR
jgi:hypothetical protein